MRADHSAHESFTNPKRERAEQPGVTDYCSLPTALCPLSAAKRARHVNGHNSIADVLLDFHKPDMDEDLRREAPDVPPRHIVV